MFNEEAILKHTLENAQIGYWDWDISSNRKYVSTHFRAMFGHEHYQSSTPGVWLEALHPDDLSRVTLAYERHVASRGAHPFRVKARYYHRNGSVMWMQCQGKVIAWDKESRPLRMVGSHVDITAQQQAEESLKRYQRALTSLKRIATNTRLKIEEQINVALQEVSNYLGLSVGIVSQIEGGVYKIINVFNTEDFPLEVNQTFNLCDTYCSITHRADQALGLHHVGQSAWAAHPCYLTTKLETYIGVPLKVRGKRYGTVNFSSSTPRSQPFSPYDLEFMELLSNWVGYVLEKRDAKHALEMMVGERTAALEERNQQLADYAFLNAHKVRGPLARILGLADALPLADSRAEEEEYLRLIVQSAQELDTVIRTAAHTLGTLGALKEEPKLV